MAVTTTYSNIVKLYNKMFKTNLAITLNENKWKLPRCGF